MARGGEIIQKQHFLSSRRHNLPSKVRLRNDHTPVGTSTCGCNNRPYSCCQSLKPSLVFLNRASYGRRRNNDVTSQEREVTMMLRHDLRTDVQICGKSASQASLFVRHGRGVNRVYNAMFSGTSIFTFPTAVVCWPC